MQMHSKPSTAPPAEQPASPIRVCPQPDCGKKLQSNNRNGYCRRHRRQHRPKGKSKIVGPYKDGLSLAQVAARTHVNVNEVRRVIKEAGCMRSKAEGIRLVKRGRSRDSADMWIRVKLRIIERKSIQEIAKQLKLTPEAINSSLHRMGWPVKACHSFGEVFDRAALRRLKEMSGLEVPDLAQELSMPVGTLEGLLSTRRPDDELRFDTARKIVEWRNGLFFRLLPKASRHSGHGRHSRQSIILAFFPNLGESYQFLMEVLHRLAKPLPKNLQWEGQHELQGYLCEQAMRETAEEKAGTSPGHLFRRFLSWAPDLMPFLAEKLEDLRGVHHRELAWEIMAGSLGTKAQFISGLDSPSRVRRTKQISPDQMSRLISQNGADRVVAQQQQQQPEAPKKTKNKRGPDPEPVQDNEWFKIGVAVEREIPIGRENDRHSLIEARRRVVAGTRLSYDTVAQYHGKYRRWLKKQPLMTIPA
jgi:AraC-like DNA-binding protein